MTPRQERDFVRSWVASWTALSAGLCALHIALFIFEMYWPALIFVPVLSWATVNRSRVLASSLELEAKRDAMRERARADLARGAGRRNIPAILGEVA